MRAAEWDGRVNAGFSFEGEYGHEPESVEVTRFESGKERRSPKNSWTPLEFPAVSLMLDNSEVVASHRTEAELFAQWHERELRGGTVPFRIPRLGRNRRRETAAYVFIPDSLFFDGFGSSVRATFGLREVFVETRDVLVRFDRNNGDPGSTDARPDAVFLEYPDTTAELPLPPERPNYDFAGWNAERDGSGEWFRESFSAERSMALFAIWRGTFVARKIREVGLHKLVRLGSADETIVFDGRIGG